MTKFETVRRSQGEPMPLELSALEAAGTVQARGAVEELEARPCRQAFPGVERNRRERRRP